MKTWRITWILGALILSLYKLLGYHFFYLYYYFFLIGFISFFHSLFKYIKIEEEGITFYFGIFYDRKNIKISWNQFEYIKLSSYNKSHMKTVGGRVRIPVKVTEEKSSISFKLKKPISCKIKSEIIKLKSKNHFVKKISINNEGNEILLKVPPEGGFRNLLKDINKFYPIINENSSEIFVFAGMHTLITMLNALIFLIVFFLGVIL